MLFTCTQKYYGTHLPKIIKILHDHGHKSSLSNFCDAKQSELQFRSSANARKLLD